MIKKHYYKLALAALLALPSVSAIAQDTDTASKFTWGGDVRFRMVSLNDIPLEAARNIRFKIEESNFTRFRTRLWGKYVFNNDYQFKIRAVNEFRNYDVNNLRHDVAGKIKSDNTWKALDEIVFDELYLDINNQFGGKLNFRIGRQALIYGTGKVLLEGNPLDGSRSVYNDAIKAVYKINDKNTLDFFYFNNPNEDSLAIHSSHRNLVEWDEEGAAIYGKSKSFDKVPFEYYYVYKDEKRHGADGDRVHLNTMGGRIMPKFTPTINANIEFASQWGSQGGTDIGGTLFDSQLNWNIMPDSSLKLTPSIGYYYLSGDDAGSSDNEAWHPVLSRWPQFSELYLYSFIDGAGGHNIGSWSNISMPWIGLSMVPMKDTNLSIRYYKMKANEIDRNSHPGLGDDRGDLITAKLKFKINKQWYGHLVAEFLDPGNYYQDGMDKAHFLRAEINYKF